jgi:phosphoribosylanthranilate isomerase
VLEMIVKICGIKTLDDALVAANAGADMLGFNFYPPSPRSIELDTCTEIISQLTIHHPQLTTVGIFVNETPQKIFQIMKSCGLDLAQLCGDESLGELTELSGRGFKAVRPHTQVEGRDMLATYRRSDAPAILVDAPAKNSFGGAGKTGDWSVARSLAEQAPILLAGGLHPENVAAAVQAVDPWGVDVASGVESSRGIKDPSKIRAFVAAAKTAHSDKE